MADHLRAVTGREIYLFLDWDVFLAWVPLGLSLIIELAAFYLKKMQTAVKMLILLPLGLVWLLFYPNAAYLITDMLHPFMRVQADGGGHFVQTMEFWQHLFIFLTAASVGVLLSVVSLYSLHQLVRQAFGIVTGWLFAVVILLLSSFGIYIGRFVRWNTWDVWARPHVVFGQLYEIVTNAKAELLLIPFTLSIFAFTLFFYVVFYAFTWMRR
ncbi:DUF1361 domain-containing protein [Paenibacillus algorifonticola]|uniref:DUF1361 domain-containing protein n=1 Tax=Paenibacillus algorifonticola TaxID=684063 RepID=UPI000698019B|nr:DUF1361 domain-containing protein [Paenibacillus algorifonticola]